MNELGQDCEDCEINKMTLTTPPPPPPPPPLIPQYTVFEIRESETTTLPFSQRGSLQHWAQRFLFPGPARKAPPPPPTPPNTLVALTLEVLITSINLFNLLINP